MRRRPRRLRIRRLFADRTQGDFGERAFSASFHRIFGRFRINQTVTNVGSRLAAVVLNELGLKASKVSAHLTQRWNDPVWRRRELVERLGVEKAFQEPSIRERFSDAKCQEIEELLKQLRDAEDAAMARQEDVNEFGLLWAEALALRDRAQLLLVD